MSRRVARAGILLALCGMPALAQDQPRLMYGRDWEEQPSFEQVMQCAGPVGVLPEGRSELICDLDRNQIPTNCKATPGSRATVTAFAMCLIRRYKAKPDIKGPIFAPFTIGDPKAGATDT